MRRKQYRISRGRQLFFFSSRRRHTRFDCDWSSDVCSSDLEQKEVTINLLNTTNALDCAKDVRLEFGDVVEVPERSEEHTSELQSQSNLVCRLLLEKKKTKINKYYNYLVQSMYFTVLRTSFV